MRCSDAVLSPPIDYINAHAPTTRKRQIIFGTLGIRRPNQPHSGLLQQVDVATRCPPALVERFSLLTLTSTSGIPPTINSDVPDPAIPFDVVPNRARPRVTA